MQTERLKEILTNIQNVHAAVVGDICLDIYWQADMRLSELSRETPHYMLPIVEERMSPGGGGNVVANMASLKPSKVYAVGVIGDDWRGAELSKLLCGVNHLITAPGRFTSTFCKPLRGGYSHVVYEDPRLDFLSHKPLEKEIEDRLIDSLGDIATKIDVLCVSDQLPCGTITDRVRECILKLAGDGLTVIADSRERIGMYIGCIIKPNEVEGTKAAGVDDFREAALQLAAFREVIMTIGAEGSLYAANGEITHIPARAVTGEIDIVGAGDSFLSGFALATAAGATRLEAASIAGLCSEVTIQKIGTTGTASAEEIIERYGQAYEN
ncbi:MAG: PfkB family carbohydrate kinase [Defluviitaleaceae bacterium]|nr:PfkB family carbohydrate kinase [Defluviitaleaceae bacterium]